MWVAKGIQVAKLPNMEPRITTPTLNVNSECFQPKQTVESFENGGGFVGYSKGHSTMLLSTAVVYCQNSRGEVFSLRALLDSGSQSNLITHEAVLALGLKCERINTSIRGVNGTPQFIKNKVSTVVSSKNRQFQELMEFLVVPKITGLTPTNKLDISGIKIPEYIKLSDEDFYSPGRIDLLLSNQIFFEILNSGKLKLADEKLILQDTVFGYVTSGVMSHNYTKKSYCGLVTNANELNNSIKRFWEIENCPDFEIPTMSREEKLCEEHFTSTYNRDETGRFIVKMPLSRDPSCLGDSKQMALRRLNSLWRRLVQDPKILELYRNFIHEYLEMGHMEEVVEDEDSAIVYYLPHHGVYRQESKITHLRVVFNASSITTSGESLSSLQLNGGVIQRDLFSILLNFRARKFAVTADIKKMFRMILIDESQRDLLRIVCKDKIDSPVKIFRLTTVTYGTKSAPYLARRSLKQLVIDDGDKYPLAAEVIMSDVYMDDLLTGADDLESGRKLQVQLVSMLKGAGMLLCSKSKVAPLKSITIPRLELCGAVLLSKFLKRTLDAFKVNISQIYLWTDSSIALAWIKKPLAQLKTFVRNRVSIIQELTESDFWKHVNSENNPADILSRGISPDKIQHCELWWFGPPFLHQYKELEPYDITAVEGDDLFLQELKETSDFPLCALLKNIEPLNIISNCSSFTKLQRVTTWCKRFIENARHPMCRTMGPFK
ncbi:integrase catalytic domain-containing protein [Trichonephila clavipes]|nr:integrase catalytic domain-containing protein [Trichonephila clavipes]